MPPRPFPLPLAIGTDICVYTRFLKYLPSPLPSPSTHVSTTTASLRPWQSKERTLDPEIGLPKSLFRLLDKVFTAREQRMFWERWCGRGGLKVGADFSRLRVGAGGGDVGGGNGGSGGVERRGGQKRKMDQDERDRVACARWIGGRWAAKEAIIKSYSASCRRLYMRDIEIHSAPTGAPFGIVLDARTSILSQDTIDDAPTTSDIKDDSSRRGQAIYIAWKAESETRKRQQQILQTPDDGGEEKPAKTAPEKSSARILKQDGVLDLAAVKDALQNEAEPDAQRQIVQDDPSDEAERGQSGKEEAWQTVQGQIVQLSISHDGEYVVATALAPVV